MRIRLIPCMISASRTPEDNIAKFHGVTFEKIMPKFGINIDADTPAHIVGNEILTSSYSFASVFVDLQNKAIDFWKEFANEYRKEPLDKKLENNFYLEIVKEAHGVFAFLVDEISEVRQIRFIIENIE